LLNFQHKPISQQIMNVLLQYLGKSTAVQKNLWIGVRVSVRDRVSLVS